MQQEQIIPLATCDTFTGGVELKLREDKAAPGYGFARTDDDSGP